MTTVVTETVPTPAAPEQAGPWLRTKADAEKDEKEALDNYVNKAYQDWPNEAGFEGLTEERGPIDLTVTGSIPEWAAGSLFRTGPGGRSIEGTPQGDFKFDHWFDGLAHTHRFDIIAPASSSEPTQVKYSSRRQSEKMVKYFQEHGVGNNVTFGQRADPCIGFLGKMMGTYSAVTQNKSISELHEGNIAVAVHLNPPGLPDLSTKGKPATVGGHRGIPKIAWTTTDAAVLKQFDPATLEPIGTARQTSLHPDLKGQLSAAHAQRDPITGDMFNFNLEMTTSAAYRVFRTSSSTGETDILATLKGPRAKAAYIHSLFLTENYVILCIPCSHLGMSGAKVPWVKNIVEAIDPFDATKKMAWFVIDRRSEPGQTRGVVAEFESDAGFFFHTVNAFEVKDEKTGETEIVCDVIQYDNFDVIKSFYYDAMLDRNDERKPFSTAEQLKKIFPQLARHRLAVGVDGKGQTEVKRTNKEFTIPAPHAGELPTMNPSFATRKSRYVYAITSRGLSTLAEGLVKTDMETRNAAFWLAPKGHTPGEAIFVARPGGEEEDDGVLLSVVLDGFGKHSYLLCLDARTMVELGRAVVPIVVGFGFHGTHHRASL